jgi:hypothetical protein
VRIDDCGGHGCCDKVKSKYEYCSRGPMEGRRRMGCLVEDDDGTMRLENLFDLLRIFLGYTLFEYLWHRFDKLFRLDPTYSAEKKKAKQG